MEDAGNLISRQDAEAWSGLCHEGGQVFGRQGVVPSMDFPSKTPHQARLIIIEAGKFHVRTKPRFRLLIEAFRGEKRCYPGDQKPSDHRGEGCHADEHATERELVFIDHR